MTSPTKPLELEGRAGDLVHPHAKIATNGTPITCPKCSAEVGRFTADIYPGFRIGVDSISWHPGQEKHAHEAATCKTCGEAYMKHFTSLAGYTLKVHTPIGWL